MERTIKPRADERSALRPTGLTPIDPSVQEKPSRVVRAMHDNFLVTAPCEGSAHNPRQNTTQVFEILKLEREGLVGTGKALFLRAEKLAVVEGELPSHVSLKPGSLVPPQEQAKHLKAVLDEIGTSEGVNDRALVMLKAREEIRKQFKQQAQEEGVALEKAESYFSALKEELGKLCCKNQVLTGATAIKPQHVSVTLDIKADSALSRYIGVELTALESIKDFSQLYLRPLGGSASLTLPAAPTAPQLANPFQPFPENPLIAALNQNNPPAPLEHQSERATLWENHIKGRAEDFACLAAVLPPNQAHNAYLGFQYPSLREAWLSPNVHKLYIDGLGKALQAEHPSAFAAAARHDPIDLFSFAEISDVVASYKGKDPIKAELAEQFFRSHLERFKSSLYDDCGKLKYKDLPTLAQAVEREWSSYFANTINPYYHFLSKGSYNHYSDPQYFIDQGSRFSLFSQRAVAEMLKEDPVLFRALVLKHPAACFSYEELGNPNRGETTASYSYYKTLAEIVAAEAGSGGTVSSDRLRTVLATVKSPYRSFADVAALDPIVASAKIEDYRIEKRLPPDSKLLSSGRLNELIALNDADKSNEFFSNLTGRVLAVMRTLGNESSEGQVSKIWGELINDLAKITQHEHAARSERGDQAGVARCEALTKLLAEQKQLGSTEGTSIASLVKNLSGILREDPALRSLFGYALSRTNIEFEGQLSRAVSQELAIMAERDAGIETNVAPGLGAARQQAEAVLGTMGIAPEAISQDADIYRVGLLLTQRALLQHEYAQVRSDNTRLEKYQADLVERFNRS